MGFTVLFSQIISLQIPGRKVIMRSGKRLTAFLLAAGCMLSGMGVQAAQPPVQVAALKGPTAIGMVKMMEDAETAEEAPYEFSVMAAVDEVGPLLVQGKADLAALPANMASILYHNTEGEIQVLAVNTLGVLYLVGTDEEISSVGDLAGKTIYASGKGATPEYALDYILTGSGLDPEKDVQIEWKSEHAECLASLLADKDSIAMLPQPFVTTARMKDDSVKVLLDLTAEWDALQEGKEDASSLITGVLAGRRAFIEENPEQVEAFLTDYAASVAYVNENVDDAAALTEKFDIIPAAVAKQAIPECHIVYLDGKEMQEKLSGYLAVLAELNPQAVGGSVPEDDFFFVK